VDSGKEGKMVEGRSRIVPLVVEAILAQITAWLVVVLLVEVDGSRAGRIVVLVVIVATNTRGESVQLVPGDVTSAAKSVIMRVCADK
jgi:hypothetical protein